MVRKLFRTGNSLAVAIPGAAAAALGVAEGDYVRVEHDAAAGAAWTSTESVDSAPAITARTT
jgi:antitoxin component of MazEF toxin-antitoxin module